MLEVLEAEVDDDKHGWEPDNRDHPPGCVRKELSNIGVKQTYVLINRRMDPFKIILAKFSHLPDERVVPVNEFLLVSNMGKNMA